jgi:hypothetical protein
MFLTCHHDQDILNCLLLHNLALNILSDFLKCVFHFIRDKWDPLIVVRCVLRLRMEKQPSDMEGSCEYIK